MQMLVKSIAPWFGGKRSLASDIVAELGPHSAYWELFAGSAAVVLAKEPSSHETIIDLHGQLTNLARVLQSDTCAVDLYARL